MIKLYIRCTGRPIFKTMLIHTEDGELWRVVFDLSTNEIEAVQRRTSWLSSSIMTDGTYLLVSPGKALEYLING